MKRLEVARGFALDTSYVTKTAAILAQRRVGKTYTASVIAEEFVAQRLPFVAIDPTGAWWGLRSSCPVIILGGSQGDVPLLRTSGKLVADLVVEHPNFYILDLSHFDVKEAERQFATDFAERLYRRKAQISTPLHLFVDEADIFVPQQSPSGDKRMLGAFESIVRRGGLRGLGTTLISQRAAVVNKNVLEQLDMLIVLRTVGPNDRKAIDGYVKAYGDEEQRQQLLGSLATLQLGEAWFWEPGADVFKRVKVRKRRTFNSSATPGVGAKITVPKLATVDLKAVREQMAATIEKIESDDPKLLHREIERLKMELSRAPARVEEVIHEVQRIPDGLEDALKQAVRRTLMDVDANVLEPLLTRIGDDLKGEIAAVLGEDFPSEVRLRQPSDRRGIARDMVFKGESFVAGTTTELKPVKLAKNAQTKLLMALATYPEGMTEKRLAAITGMSPKKSTLGIAIQKLKRAGLVEGNSSLLKITAAGLAACPTPDLPTGAALIEHWQAQLGNGASRRIFDSMVGSALDHDSKPWEPRELADTAGVDYEASTFGIAMQKLRRLGLVVGFRLDPDLVGAISR